MESLKRKDRRKQWVRGWYDRNWKKLAVATIIVAMLGIGWLAGSILSTHQERQRAEQAEKRLAELREENVTEIQRLEVAFDLELERRIEEARIEAQAEMAGEMAVLNQKLEEQNQAYDDLSTALDDLTQTYNELMDLMFGEGWQQSSLPGIVGEITVLTAQMASGEDMYASTLQVYHDHPELQIRMRSWGRYLLENDLDHAFAPAPGIPWLGAGDMADALKDVYNGCRWDGFIALQGCERSMFHGVGLEYCRYLRERGRAWENCLATLYAESTYGLGGSIHYGILYGNYPNTLQGYCDLLQDHGVSNDPWEQSCFWNMPGYLRYQNGFLKIVSTIEGFWP